MGGFIKIIVAMAVILLATAAASPGLAQSSPGSKNADQTGQGSQKPTLNVLQVLERLPGNTMYVDMIKSTNSDQLLQGKGPYMVFAPTDDAIKSDMGENSTEDLTADSELSKDLVKGSIVEKSNLPPESTDQLTLTAMNGNSIDIVKTGDKITANSANAIGVVPATNGMIVVVDAVV
jgi:uncharacterized surface protein with fasciclin (FAS1) repeats